MLVAFCKIKCMSAKTHSNLDDQFVNIFVHHAGTNHTHHPTDVPHLEDMVGGMTLERVSGIFNHATSGGFCLIRRRMKRVDIIM